MEGGLDKDNGVGKAATIVTGEEAEDGGSGGGGFGGAEEADHETGEARGGGGGAEGLAGVKGMSEAIDLAAKAGVEFEGSKFLQSVGEGETSVKGVSQGLADIRKAAGEGDVAGEGEKPDEPIKDGLKRRTDDAGVKGVAERAGDEIEKEEEGGGKEDDPTSLSKPIS